MDLASTINTYAHNTYAHALPHQRREVADKVGDVLFGETPQREPGQASGDHS